MRLLYCDWSHTVMPFLFADVEYHGLIYGDAELREGVWYFRNSEGAVPGIQQDSAMSVLAEVGPNRSTFPSAAHLSSWAGLCPGNRRSAGKEKSGRTTRGNRWLRTTMTQCAWAASLKKNCYLKGKFWRLAAEGKKRAIAAIAHNLLVLVYHVLATGQPYRERDGFIEEPHKQRRIRHHIRALGRLGINVGCRPAT